MLPFRVVVAGSSSITKKEAIWPRLDKIMAEKIKTHAVTIISGCARGVDSLAIEWARSRALPVEKRPADWDKLGKKAGLVRNKIMLDSADAVIVFHDGKSTGSAHMASITTAAKKPLRYIVMAG